jgi:hypothetical protein
MKVSEECTKRSCIDLINELVDTNDDIDIEDIDPVNVDL